MAELKNDRVAVTAGPRSLGVSIRMGEVIVAVTLPSPAGLDALTEDAARAAAIRLAQRALTVAQEELQQDAPEARP